MTWLLQGRRAVAARRRQLLQAVPRAVSATSAAPDDHGLRVAVPGGRRYHRPECAAVDGKPVERMPVPAHVRAGRRPCGLCDG
jgi:hypothetical protein